MSREYWKAELFVSCPHASFKRLCVRWILSRIDLTRDLITMTRPEMPMTVAYRLKSTGEPF